MIILEFLWLFIKWIFYYTTRPIIWLITARDCRHCRYGVWLKVFKSYYNPFNWGCDVTVCDQKYACQSTPWRCHFERRERKCG